MEVVIGAVLALAGTVVAQVFQGRHEERRLQAEIDRQAQERAAAREREQRAEVYRVIREILDVLEKSEDRGADLEWILRRGTRLRLELLAVAPDPVAEWILTGPTWEQIAFGKDGQEHVTELLRLVGDTQLRGSI